MPSTGVRVGHMMPNKAVSDTMPRRGKVTDLCKEWLVHEDGALAYQLQQQEVEKHYSGNKSRNAIVREDIPMARAEQQRAEQEAFEEHLRQVALLEEHDAQVARKIAEQIERDEEEQRIRLEAYDSKIARCIQEKEKRSVGDINSVGLPPPPSLSPPVAHGRSRATIAEVEERFRRLQASSSMSDECSGGSETFSWPPPPDSDQLSRASQEKQDEEFAKMLQEEEAKAGLDPIDRDRLLAIEVQDSELARMLQEKEKARLKRAKEKARAKALAKKQMEEEKARVGAESVLPPTRNIATAIDPTYSPGSSTNSTMTRPSLAYPAENGYVLDQLSEDYHPPYMPVQGQRRPLSGDKKKKKIKETECKQQ